jgi:hypothetical protein
MGQICPGAGERAAARHAWQKPAIFAGSEAGWHEDCQLRIGNAGACSHWNRVICPSLLPAGAIPTSAKENLTVAITGASTIGPSVPAPTAGHQAHDAVAVPAAAPATAPTPDVPAPAPSTTLSSMGFALHYDADTQRLILEVREPVTGYVIYQMPPKYVIKQFSTSASAVAAPARGARVDSAV